MTLVFLKLDKLVIVIVLVCCILLMAGCSKAKDTFAPPPLPSLKLTAEVTVFAEKLIITNRDTFMWNDPLVTITSGGTSHFYRASVEDFVAGDHKIYTIDKFINSSGETFDSKSHPISVVIIQAKDEKGNAYGYRYYF